MVSRFVSEMLGFAKASTQRATGLLVRLADLRIKSNFLSRINVIWPVQPRAKKYSGFPKSQITLYPPPSTPLEGRIAIVTDAGLDAMDVGRRF